LNNNKNIHVKHSDGLLEKQMLIHAGRPNKNNKKLIRRWDSERELSLRRHRTRTTKYNRLVHS